MDTLLGGLTIDASFELARSSGGYTTNLPLGDLTNGQARIAFRFDGVDRPPEHMEGDLPSFEAATGWINPPPLTPAGPRGKVVLGGPCGSEIPAA